MKKIMFNDRYGLTTAVIEKRKTVTRMLIKNTPNSIDSINYSIDGGISFNGDGCIYPPYHIGEIVAVAQSYKTILSGKSKTYDSIWDNIRVGLRVLLYSEIEKVAGWLNKMFVKADLMPHQIRITSITAVRLQDFSKMDCLREGIELDEDNYAGIIKYVLPNTQSRHIGTYAIYNSARKAFASLIDKISGKGTWDKNPFVWRVEFELIK